MPEKNLVGLVRQEKWLKNHKGIKADGRKSKQNSHNSSVRGNCGEEETKRRIYRNFR